MLGLKKVNTESPEEQSGSLLLEIHISLGPIQPNFVNTQFQISRQEALKTINLIGSLESNTRKPTKFKLKF